MLPFLTASRPKNSEHLNTQCKIIEWLVRLMAGGLGYGWYAEVGRGRKRGPHRVGERVIGRERERQKERKGERVRGRRLLFHQPCSIF